MLLNVLSLSTVSLFLSMAFAVRRWFFLSLLAVFLVENYGGHYSSTVLTMPQTSFTKNWEILPPQYGYIMY